MPLALGAGGIAHLRLPVTTVSRQATGGSGFAISNDTLRRWSPQPQIFSRPLSVPGTPRMPLLLLGFYLPGVWVTTTDTKQVLVVVAHGGAAGHH